MGAQPGGHVLLKIARDGSFETVAGLRTKAIRFDARMIDVTDAESAGRWRELLADAGVRRAAVSGSGLFKDATSDEAVRALFFGGGVSRFQMIVPDFGTIEGPFQIVRLDYGGAHDGEATFEIALESAGELTFGPAS